MKFKAQQITNGRYQVMVSNRDEFILERNAKELADLLNETVQDFMASMCFYPNGPPTVQH